MVKLILASKSQARHDMLAAAGLDFEVMPADLDERALDDGHGDARAAALSLAKAKAQSVSAKAPETLVIGADQTLALGELRLHKPSNRREAEKQLGQMAGKTHKLYSGCALAEGGAVREAIAGEVAVTFRDFSPEFLALYLDRAGDRVFTSVGGYQIEGLGAQLIERIEGDWPNVLGLPLFELLELLRKMEFLPR